MTRCTQSTFRFDEKGTLFSYVFVSSGTFTGGIIRLISNIRLKHGRDAVKLSNCGRFVLANDFSDMADIAHIDLSGIGSLEGACFFMFFFLNHR